MLLRKETELVKAKNAVMTNLNIDISKKLLYY